MHLKKMIASLVAAVLLCLNFSVASYADTITPLGNYGISLEYEIANNCTSNLEIVNGTAECKSIATGTNAVSITVTQALQNTGACGYGRMLTAQRGQELLTSDRFACTTQSPISRAERIV